MRSRYVLTTIMIAALSMPGPKVMAMPAPPTIAQQPSWRDRDLQQLRAQRAEARRLRRTPRPRGSVAPAGILPNVSCPTPAAPLEPSSYLNIADGQVNDQAAAALVDTFREWANKPAATPLTIVVHFHGGLVDFSCGLSGATALAPEYAAQGAVPYFFIYNVGIFESIGKGDRSRGLFKLADNQAAGLLSRIPQAESLDDLRHNDAREHQEMTKREDWFRIGMPPESIVGRLGQLAWAYMKQSIVDGLDLTHPESGPAAVLSPGEPCDQYTSDEQDPWPHIAAGIYDPRRAGARTFLCNLKDLIEARARNGGVTRIVLVGHSTGAIYITQLIREAHRLWVHGTAATQKVNVILLAPAVTYETLGQMIDEAGGRVADLRIFTMQDDYEQADWVLSEYLESRTTLLSRFYDKSLLYAVSGIFEPARYADEPLIGMARFQTPETVADLESRADNVTDVARIKHVDEWLNGYGGSSGPFVYSPSYQAPIPFGSCTYHHGDFANPYSVTMTSVSELVRLTANGLPWPTTYVPTLAAICPPPDYPVVNPAEAPREHFEVSRR